MKAFLKVKDHPGLVRDPVSKAIISVDQQGRNDYNSKRLLVEKSTNSVNELREEVNNIKNDVLEIKQLLKNLLNKDK